MKNCLQTENQSIYQHGLSVKDHIFQIIKYLETNHLEGNWILPEWINKYRQELLNQLYSRDIIEEYTIFHDCGKPYCLQYDETGKRHFPNHANVSYQKWLEADGSKEVAFLIKMDMDIHDF